MGVEYYIPKIEDFHIGFEYEEKENFMDGTVKTKEQYEKSKWVIRIFESGDLPYIERSLTGKNAENGLFGIRARVK